MIRKTSGAQELKRYRPNSLLNQMQKVWEHWLSSLLRDPINEGVAPAQHGFRAHRQTTHVVHSC